MWLLEKLWVGRVAICVDNNEGGDRLIVKTRQHLTSEGIKIVKHRPKWREADWDDVLQATKR